MLNQRLIYEFDDYRVDTGQFLLTKEGLTTPITPTVFRILNILLEHAGQVVTKDEIIRLVWPDCYVEESNLNRNVSTLRQVLGERPRDHKYIETIPKEGYRFVAPVRKMEYQPPTGSARRTLNGAAQQIVGRDNERKDLRHAFELARQGHGGLVCVSGDAGIGKTALIEAFLEDLTRDQAAFHLAEARCSDPLTETEPCIPWIEALGELAREETVNGFMKQSAPNWHREIKHLGSGSARKMKRELHDFCRKVSAIHPLVIVLDDFHWADVNSVDLVAFLSTRLESTRTLIVVCYDMVELKVNNHPFLQVRADLVSRSACSEIKLDLLEPKDVVKHLALEYRNRQFPEDYAGFLHARTDGNPLFIREFVRGPGELTESIRTLIQRKLDRVNGGREVLTAASAQGREFDSAILAKSLRMKPEKVEETLRGLAEVHGLIQRIGEEQYRFVYAFYHEVCTTLDVLTVAAVYERRRSHTAAAVTSLQTRTPDILPVPS